MKKEQAIDKIVDKMIDFDNEKYWQYVRANGGRETDGIDEFFIDAVYKLVDELNDFYFYARNREKFKEQFLAKAYNEGVYINVLLRFVGDFGSLKDVKYAAERYMDIIFLEE